MCTYIYKYPHYKQNLESYGVATISTLLKITGLFCRISSLLQGSFAKETYHFKEPTTRSHPIPNIVTAAPLFQNTHTYTHTQDF